MGLIKANVHTQKEITQFSLYMSGQWSKLEIVIPETRYLRMTDWHPDHTLFLWKEEK